MTLSQNPNSVTISQATISSSHFNLVNSFVPCHDHPFHTYLTLLYVVNVQSSGWESAPPVTSQKQHALNEARAGGTDTNS